MFLHELKHEMSPATQIAMRELFRICIVEPIMTIFEDGLIIQNSQVAALMDVPLQRLNRATPLVQATRQTMQSIGVAVLATILSSAITATMPNNVPSGGDITKLPPSVQAAIQQGIHLFQSQYITGLQHAYLATCVIAIVATILALFLPGWPAKYLPASRRDVPATPQPQPTEVG